MATCESNHYHKLIYIKIPQTNEKDNQPGLKNEENHFMHEVQMTHKYM